ncbi:hypothetical protein C7M84_003392 [Penaeus vannamei]|uniref:Uncharacterized protein n=1 Tax=Penaeus vannamei TaxID=6689 RepID=A0A3R7MC55_PENVA|nr:hypothetical protein C7M84_003392 [Penaeus vannamei]
MAILGWADSERTERRGLLQGYSWARNRREDQKRRGVSQGYLRRSRSSERTQEESAITGYHWRMDVREDQEERLIQVILARFRAFADQRKAALSQAILRRRTPRERDHRLSWRGPERTRRRGYHTGYPGEDPERTRRRGYHRLILARTPRGPGGEAITGYPGGLREDQRRGYHRLSWRGPREDRRRGYHRLSWRGPREDQEERLSQAILARTPRGERRGITGYPGEDPERPGGEAITAILARTPKDRRRGYHRLSRRGLREDQEERLSQAILARTPRGPGGGSEAILRGPENQEERLSQVSPARTPRDQEEKAITGYPGEDSERTRRRGYHRLSWRGLPRGPGGEAITGYPRTPRGPGGEAITGYPGEDSERTRRRGYHRLSWRGLREDQEERLSEDSERTRRRGYQDSERTRRRGYHRLSGEDSERTRRRGYHRLSWRGLREDQEERLSQAIPARTPRGPGGEAITGYPEEAQGPDSSRS